MEKQEKDRTTVRQTRAGVSPIVCAISPLVRTTFAIMVLVRRIGEVQLGWRS